MRISLLLTSLIAVVAACANPARACLAHAYSTEYVVMHSDLIVIGEIVGVQDAPKPHPSTRDTNLGMVLGTGAAPADEPQPSVATLHIDRTLKGQAGPTVKLGSGPVESCAPYAVHYGFTKGEKGIFCIQDVKAGVGTLRYGGCILPVGDAEVVTAIMDRAQQFARDFLSGVSASSPAEHAAGIKLSESLRAQSAQWPDDDEKAHAAADKLAQSIDALPPQAITVALAAAWGADQKWPDHWVWDSAIRAYADKHKAAIADFLRAYWPPILKRAGLSPQQIDTFLGAKHVELPTHYLAFPVYKPEYRPPPNNPVQADLLTTDFIANYNDFDQGSMFQAYGMQFETLANLDPERLAQVIPSMYASRNGHLRLVALRAIERIKGDAFVGLVLHHQMDGNVFAWTTLQRAPDKDAKLGAMLDQAASDYTLWGQASFWNSLRAGGCFEPVCIGRAIALLDHPTTNPAPNRDEDAKELKSALAAYLDAAKAARQPPPATLPSAEEYKAWFAKHPAATQP